MEEQISRKNNINSNNASTKIDSLNQPDFFSFNDDKNFQNANTTIDNSESERNEKKFVLRRPIDIYRNRYPFCMVWTPLPLISWIIPIIGHTGICGSDGKIYDFAGSYYISEDNMAFGNPYKYVELNPDMAEQIEWDDCIAKCNERFTNEEHNICCNNCHSHVAHALNLINYKKFSTYNMIHIWWMFLLHGKYVSTLHILKTYLGFIIFLLIILVVFKL